MAIEIKIPSVGESVSEVVLGKWLRQEGEAVKKDEIILSLETDKVNVEVPAPEDGVLRKISKKEGDSATIGEVVAVIEAGAQASAGAAAPAPKVEPSQPAAPAAEGKAEPAPAPVAASGATGGHVMPAAQRLAHERGIDAASVPGTGPKDRVLKEDVQRAPAAGADAPALKVQQAPAPGAPGHAGQGTGAAPAALPSAPTAGQELVKVVPMTPLRRRVAERLVQAQQTAAILTTFNEVDMTNVMATRKKFQESFVARYGIKLGFMSFFVKASIDALRAFPEINAEIRGTDIVYRNHYDVGVAVGSPKGLFVPVVKRAELLSFAELELAIANYGKRAQAGKLTLDDMTGGTFTISNGGVYGSLMSTPILNPPQSGILGMHSIVERPVGVDGKIELRPMMYIALSYDHRIVDGRGAVSFLKRVKECIEAPERMLLEI